MSERLTSFLILSGGVLVFLLLWYLSVRIVRRDMRRRNAPEVERKAWTAAAILLPVFGFALYLFMYVLRGYLTPVQAAEEGSTPPPEDQESLDPTLNAREMLVLPTTGAQAGPSAPVPAPQVEAPLADPALRPEITPSTIPVVQRPVSGRYGLFVSKGPHAGQLFDLAPLPQRIGRGPEATIPLDADLNVSRSHAEIYEWNGLLRIRDLGSTHGTLINGVPVSDQSFNLGDHLSVGGTLLVLRELP